MAKNGKLERARQLYLQTQKAYKTGQPDFFNRVFAVPAEKLYQEMCNVCKLDIGDEHRRPFRLTFDSRLRKMLYDKKVFDANYLGKDIVKTIEKQPQEKYTVYFGVPIKKSSNTPLPFGKTVTSGGVTFEHISHKQFERAHKKECLDEYYRKCESNMRFGESRDWVMREFYYFRAIIMSNSDETAANRAIDAFEILYACASVAQNGNSYKHTLGGTKTKSRSVMAPAGLLLTTSANHSKCELLWTSDIRMSSDESLTFTSNNNRNTRYRLYRRVCREDTPISKRIKLVILEFAKALHVQDPHIRQLSLWRCLEVATGKHGSSRTEQEIIKILGNYYKDSTHWRQQGEIIKDVRNKFVHQGAALESDVWGSVDKYLNWTQEYVDVVLSILLWMRKNELGKKNSNDIDDFFDLYVKTDRTLKIAGKMLKGRSKKT